MLHWKRAEFLLLSPLPDLFLCLDPGWTRRIGRWTNGKKTLGCLPHSPSVSLSPCSWCQNKKFRFRSRCVCAGGHGRQEIKHGQMPQCSMNNARGRCSFFSELIFELGLRTADGHYHRWRHWNQTDELSCCGRGNFSIENFTSPDACRVWHRLLIILASIDQKSERTNICRCC